MSTKKVRKAKRTAFAVRNMDRAACGLAMEKKLRKLDGVEEVGSAIMLNRIFVDYDDSKLDAAEIKKAIKAAAQEELVRK